MSLGAEINYLEIPGFFEKRQKKQKNREKVSEETSATTTTAAVLKGYGTISAENVIERIKQRKAEEEKKKQSAMVKLTAKKAKEDAFHKCKDLCICGKTPCEASGLKLCLSCKEVKKKCFKMDCKNAKMQKCAYDMADDDITDHDDDDYALQCSFLSSDSESEEVDPSEKIRLKPNSKVEKVLNDPKPNRKTRRQLNPIQPDKTTPLPLKRIYFRDSECW